jgi:hypothetical protein
MTPSFLCFICKIEGCFPVQCGCLALRGFDQFHGFNHRASDSAFKKRDPTPTAKLGGFLAQLPGMVAVGNQSKCVRLLTVCDPLFFPYEVPSF